MGMTKADHAAEVARGEGLAQARAASSADLHRALVELREALDAAHAAHLWIPPAVVTAAATLHSLAIAWGHNAQGKPTPPEHRAQLGL